MYFTKALLLSASFVVAALAQGIQITQYPNEGAVGSQPTVIGWSGGDGTSVITITLKQGGNVISTILQRNGQASTFTWTPSNALPDASNYVLEITQGTTVYDTPDFSLTGGQVVSSTSAVSTSTVSTSTSTATALPTSTASTTVVSGSVTSTLPPTVSPTAVTPIITTTAPVVVPPVYTNGTAIVTPVLTSTTLVAAPTTAGVGGTATGAGSSPSVKPASAASSLAGSLVAVLGAFAAAVVYLG
ncbi:hypothetical protein MMC11_007733 [Xylographa trunciseda]|nr:hypothetical protein [Xylographa trunciseda]